MSTMLLALLGINFCFLGLVASQSPYLGLGECGRDCVGDAADNGTCSTIDLECMCERGAPTSEYSCCLSYGCSGVPAVTTAIKWWIDTCREQNVDIDALAFTCSDSPLLASTSIPSSTPRNPSQVSGTGAASITADSDSSQSNGNGGGKSDATVIGASVGASVGGVLLIALGVGLFFFLRKRKNAKNPPQAFIPGQKSSPDMAYGPGGYAANHEDAFHPNNFNATPVDDDTLARMRRFSDDGTAAPTVSMTVAGRTNDDFRPMPA